MMTGGGDTTPPSVLIQSPSSNITINSNHYTVSGTADDANGLNAVYFKLNTGAFVSLGTAPLWWSNCLLVEGANTIYVYAEDKADNISTAKSVTITVDTGSPIITFTLPVNFFATNGTPIAVSGVATVTNTPDVYNITDIEASVNSGAYVSITNGGSNVVVWSTSMDLTNGTNSIVIRASADNGKNSTSSPLYVIYDTNTPTVLINPAGNITTNEIFTVTLSVDENYGYWSTNFANFVQFTTAGTSVMIGYDTTNLRYYGIDILGNTSATQNVVYTFPPLITIDGTKEAIWDTAASFSDPVDAWVTDNGANTTDPCGFDTTNIMITNDGIYLFIALDIDDTVSWSHHSALFFIDNTTLATGATNFGAGSAESWSDGDANVLNPPTSTFEGVINTWNGGHFAYKLNVTLPLVQDNSVAANARGGAGANLFVEVRYKLSEISINTGDVVKIGVITREDYWGMNNILDSGADPKLADPTVDQEIGTVSYTIH